MCTSFLEAKFAQESISGTFRSITHRNLNFSTHFRQKLLKEITGYLLIFAETVDEKLIKVKFALKIRGYIIFRGLQHHFGSLWALT